MAALAGNSHGIGSAAVCLSVIGKQRVFRLLQRLDHLGAVRCLLRRRNFRAAGGEPFHLLQLYPVPRRIADHGIEPTFALGAGPIVPHTGKSDLPVKETLFLDKRACGCDYAFDNLQQIGGLELLLAHPIACAGCLERRCFDERLCLAAHYGDWVAELSAEQIPDGRRILPAFQVQPIQCEHETDEAIERPGLRFHILPHFSAAVCFSNFGIGQRFDRAHDHGLALRIGQRFEIEQFATLGRLVDRIAHPQAKQTVSCGKVVIDEAQRCANGEGVQP